MTAEKPTVAQPKPTTNCGNCLMDRVEIVPLRDGVCPKCGADYRDTLKAGAQ